MQEFLLSIWRVYILSDSLPLSLCVLSSNAYLSTHTLKKYEENNQLLLLK